MKIDSILKLVLLFVCFIIISVTTKSTDARAITENKYVSSVKITEYEEKIKFEKIDSNFKNILLESGKRKRYIDYYDVMDFMNNGKGTYKLTYYWDPDARFETGEEIKVYLIYEEREFLSKEEQDENGQPYHLDSKGNKFYVDTNNRVYNVDGNGKKSYFSISEVTKKIKKKLLIDTIKIKDTIKPYMEFYPSQITIRDNFIFVDTDELAKVTATYNGKKIKLPNKFTKETSFYISTLTKGKKVVITATDKSGNQTKKTFVIKSAKNVKLNVANQFVISKGKISGKVKNGYNDDRVFVKIGSKTFSTYVKNNKFSIKIPKNTKTPKKVNVFLKDKDGILLDKKSVRLYKYDYFKIGMTKAQLKNSNLGSPDETYSFHTGYAYYEVWTYDNLEIYFRNGKLDSFYD